MKCKYCGFELEDGDMFCSDCGKKVEENYANLKKHKYICIGQPIGYVSCTENSLYLLDIGTEQVEITTPLLAVWSTFFDNKTESITEEDSSLIKDLLDKKCLIDISEQAQIDRLLCCVSHRQGFCSIQDNCHAIFLEKTPLVLWEKSVEFWRQSNAKNSVKNIMSLLGLTQDETISILYELLSNSVIYLTYEEDIFDPKGKQIDVSHSSEIIPHNIGDDLDENYDDADVEQTEDNLEDKYVDFICPYCGETISYAEWQIEQGEAQCPWCEETIAFIDRSL